MLDVERRAPFHVILPERDLREHGNKRVRPVVAPACGRSDVPTPNRNTLAIVAHVDRGIVTLLSANCTNMYCGTDMPLRPSNPLPANRNSRLALHALMPTCLFCLIIGSSQKLEADVIARFDFEGNDYTTDTRNPTGFNTGLNLSNSATVAGTSISDLQFSRNLDPTAALGFAADDYDNALGFSSDQNDDRSLESSNQVVYFDVNVHVGFKLNLQSLSFDSLKTRGGNANDARVVYSIFVNPEGDPAVDGLLGDTDFLTSVAHDHYAPGQPDAESTGEDFSTGRWNTGPIDLSGRQGLAGINTIAIRLYGSEGGSSDQDFGIDNLILSGEVTAIPEPACTTVLLLGIAAPTYRRRRPNAI